MTYYHARLMALPELPSTNIKRSTKHLMDRYLNLHLGNFIFLFLITALVFLLESCAGTSSTAMVTLTDEPRAIFPRPTFDFGTVMDGEIINHTFEVQNLGGATLVIEAIKPNCSCITASKPATIPPGGKGRIKVTLDTKTRGGHEIVARIMVISNDPNQPEFALTMGGIAEAYARITPPEARLDGRLGESIARRLRIVPHPQHPFTITRIRPHFGHDIRWELTPAGETVSQEGYFLTVTSTRAQPGLIIDILFLETDPPLIAPLKIMIRGRVELPDDKDGTES